MLWCRLLSPLGFELKQFIHDDLNDIMLSSLNLQVLFFLFSTSQIAPRHSHCLAQWSLKSRACCNRLPKWHQPIVRLLACNVWKISNVCSVRHSHIFSCPQSCPLQDSQKVHLQAFRKSSFNNMAVCCMNHPVALCGSRVWIALGSGYQKLRWWLLQG